MSASLSPDENELRELRARAYGPNADIQSDPVALARLSELEAAHMPKLIEDATDVARADGADDGTVADLTEPASEGSPAPSSAEPQSPFLRLVSTWAGRISLLAGALVVILVTASTVSWFFAPHPDARLDRDPIPADGVVFSMLDFLGAEVDVSSLQRYEAQWGVEPWYFEDVYGFQCLMLVIRPSVVEGANCVPPNVSLFADLTPWPQIRGEDVEPLPDGSILRFHYRGDRVEMFVYPAQAPGS
jgi:hypothetical protein